MAPRLISATLALLLSLPIAGAWAQTSAIRRETLQIRDFPDPTWRSELVRVNVAKGGVVARHTHPGIEIGYIEHGQALVKMDGHSDQTLSKGGSLLIPPATPHSVTNVGPGALTILSTYVVDKSKPVATPAP